MQKLWLPRIVYEALPYLYLMAGMAALMSAMHFPGAAWIAPYIVLIALICTHLGLGIIALRYKRRHSGGAPHAGQMTR